MTWNKYPVPVVKIHEPGAGLVEDGGYLIQIEVNLNGLKFVRQATITVGGSWSHGEIRSVLLDAFQLRTAQILREIQYAAEQGKIPAP